jgi:hypothetical protein
VDASPGPVTEAVRAVAVASGLDVAIHPAGEGGDPGHRSGPADPTAVALAASALALARELDDQGNSATSKAACVRSLLETLDRLGGLCPARDALEELVARRAARRAGNAG